MTAQPQKFIWLDFVRGLSAIAVCAGHLRAATFVDYSALGSASLLDKVFYAATGLGNQSVMVFFVLSGFFVGGSVLRAGQEFNPMGYTFTRISRLWIVLIPALILTSMVDEVIRALAPSVLSGGFASLWSSGPPSAADYSASLFNFFANVLFLQTVAAPVFGTNGPLWSLANEFWYYALFPLAALALGAIGTRKGRVPFHARVLLGGVVLALLWALPTSITSDFPVWLLGVGAYLLAGRLKPALRPGLLLAGLVAFFAAVAFSKAASLHDAWPLPPNLAIGIGFSILVVALSTTGGVHDQRAAFARFSQGISAFSYSLYLVHFPFVALIGSTLYGPGRMLKVDAAGLAQFGGWMVLLLLIGAAFWWVFERRTDVVRRAIAPARQGRSTPAEQLHPSKMGTL